MKFISSLAVSLLATTAFASAENILEAWQGFSDPDIIASGFTHRLNELPLEGAMAYNPRGWSGYYWPSKDGGINNRWYSQKPDQFSYATPSRAQIMRMTRDQLGSLAPSEKYDIFMGNYDFPLKADVSSHISRTAKEWEGICHGWAPASVNHDEPQPVEGQNPDGVIVPFGSADLKALVSYYYAFDQGNNSSTIGLRCNFGKWTGGAKECDQDLNAGAFHIVLTNKLGLSHEGFVADVDRWDEVWNQPIIGYRSKVASSYMRPSANAASTAMWELRMQTELWYVDEDEPGWSVDYGTDKQKFAKKDLVYRIELNAEGEIVGGTWESEERPDFVWQKPRVENFEGLLTGLNELLNPQR